MTRWSVAVFVSVLALAAVPTALAGQPAPDVQAQPPAPPVPSPPPAPAKHEIHGAITAGLQFLSGVTEAHGGSLDAKASRPYSDRGTVNVKATYNYAKVVVSDSPRTEIVQTNRTQASVGMDQAFSTHGVFAARSLYLRDPVQSIFFRFEQLAGVGVRYASPSKRVEFSFVPGLSMVKEDTFLDTPEGWQAGAGFYQRLAAKVDRTWSLEQSITYRHDFAVGDLSIEASAEFTGMLTKMVGLQTKYLYVRENLEPTGVKPYQQTLQLGLQVKF